MRLLYLTKWNLTSPFVLEVLHFLCRKCGTSSKMPDEVRLWTTHGRKCGVDNMSAILTKLQAAFSDLRSFLLKFTFLQMSWSSSVEYGKAAALSRAAFTSLCMTISMYLRIGTVNWTE